MKQISLYSEKYQDKIVMCFVDNEYLTTEIFVLDSITNYYDKIKKYILTNIIDGKNKKIKAIVIGYNNYKTYNKYINNIIEYKNTNTTFIDNDNYKNIIKTLDLYYVLQHDYHYGDVEPKEILTEYAFRNNIALIENSFSCLENFIVHVTEIATTIAVMANKHKNDIDFVLNNIDNQSKNIILSPVKLIIKKILNKILGNDYSDLIKAIPKFKIIKGDQLTYKKYELKNKNIYNFIDNYDFKKTGQICNYQIGVNIININKNGIYKQITYKYIDDEFYDICYVDIKSFFPTVLINNYYVPYIFKDNKQEFIDIISILMQRKDIDTSPNNIYKKFLTNIIGLFNTNGALYDPIQFYNITITGTLFILFLLERVYEYVNDIEIVNAVIDGFIIKFDKTKREIVENTINKYLNEHNYVGKIKYIHKGYFYNNNNSIIIYHCDDMNNAVDVNSINNDGTFNTYNKIIKDNKCYEIEYKGFFKNENIHNSGYPQIVILAVINNILFNSSITKTIVSNRDIKMFVEKHIYKNNITLVSNDGEKIEYTKKYIDVIYVDNGYSIVNDKGKIVNKYNIDIPYEHIYVDDNKNDNQKHYAIKHQYYLEMAFDLLDKISLKKLNL